MSYHPVGYRPAQPGRLTKRSSDCCFILFDPEHTHVESQNF
ncbi:hypothetical protein [Desulfonatronum parangueonense]